MADPFSLSTGIAGFVSLSLQITEYLREYIGAVVSAKKDAQTLVAEVEALSVVLSQFVDFLRQEDVKGVSFSDTSGLCSVIAICRDQLQAIFKKLAKVAGNAGPNKSAAQYLERLKWPFETKEISQHIQTLNRCRGIFHFSLTIGGCTLMSKSSDEILAGLKAQQDSLAQILAVLPTIPAEMSSLSDQIASIISFLPTLADTSTKINSILTVVQALQLESNVRILGWLSPLQPPKRHQDVRSIRVAGTGQWLLQEPTFQKWMDHTASGYNQVLSCYGIPGAGKTVITSLVIDHLVDPIAHGERLPETQSPAVAYMYFDYRDQKMQSPANLIGSLLRQVLTSFPSIPEDIAHLYERCLRGGKSLDLNEAESALLRLCESSKLESLYICVDALDECNSSHIGTFLKSLKTILSKTYARLFITSRPHIQDQIERHFNKPLKITIEAHQDDIKRFVSEEIEKDVDCDPDLMNNTLKKMILEKIGARSQKMFLLPALQIREVLEERTILQRKLALERLPGELYSAFSNTVERIQQQCRAVSDEAMNIIMWIHFALRPLSVNELRHALATRPGDVTLNTDNFPSLKTWLAGCLGLVVVDEETSTVRLVHFSLQEYLQTQGEKIWTRNQGHANIALTCLTYLSFEYPDNTLSPWEDFDFYDYASCQWGHHMRNEAGLTEQADSILQLSLRLLQDKAKLSRLMEVINNSTNHPGPLVVPSTDCSGLHIAAYFGVSRAVQRLLVYLDVNLKEARGRTPLSYAAENGHEAVVKLLLDVDGIELDSKDSEDIMCGQTPLSWAAGEGQESIVQLLLGMDGVDPDSKDMYGRTPLYWATLRGFATVIKLLLNAGADSNLKDSLQGQTPLCLAASFGFEDVVEILLNAGADPEVKDASGQTPLSCAAEKGHEAIARLLLSANGVNSDSKDTSGWTPLFWAASGGHEALVMLLLSAGAIPNYKNIHHDASLSLAVMFGQVSSVRALLNAEGIDPNIKSGSYNQTPLSLAAEKGHEGIVELLLNAKGVDLNIRDSYYGETPLGWATAKGHQAIVELLLNAGADPTPKKPRSRTPDRGNLNMPRSGREAR